MRGLEGRGKGPGRTAKGPRGSKGPKGVTRCQDEIVRDQEGGEELAGLVRGQGGQQGAKRVSGGYRGARRGNGGPRGAAKGKIWWQGARRTG